VSEREGGFVFGCVTRWVCDWVVGGVSGVYVYVRVTLVSCLAHTFNVTYLHAH
jgi:hypothetical protein